MRKTGGDTFPHSFTPPLSFRLVVTAFENFEYPWDAQASMLLLFCLLNVFQVLFRVKQLVKNITQRSAPRLDSYEWLGVWNSMGKCLAQWAPLVFWNLTPEQMQNPDKLVQYLEEVCCHPGNSRETQIIVMCWGLAHVYGDLCNTIQCSKGKGGKTKQQELQLAQPPRWARWLNQKINPCRYQSPLYRKRNTQKYQCAQ